MSATAPRWLGTGALLLAVLAAYWPALAGPFQFDDHQVIVTNPYVHDLGTWWGSMPGIRPLLKLSYALNWTLSPQPLGFHALNIAVHAVNVLLVRALARHWLAQLAPLLAAPAAAAWWVALLFALHPAATEAVTYVSGRSVSLMAMFYLAALLAHAVVEPQRLNGRWYWLSPLLFGLALGVRETAATLPAALLLIAWFRGVPLAAALALVKRHLLVLAVLAVPALLLPGYQRFFAHSLAARDLGSQVLGQMTAHTHLFWHSLLGLQTNIDPDLRIPDAWDGASLLALVVLASALAAAVASRRRWPWLGFAIAWYLLQLAPGNSLMPRLDLANDRHLYLALPGVALAIVVALGSLRWRGPAHAALVLLAIPLAGHTVLRNVDYRSEVALWERTTQQSPAKPRPWVNLGWARQLAHDAPGARAAYRCALALDPGHQRSLVNLSLLVSGPVGEAPDPGCGVLRSAAASTSRR